MGLSVGMVSPSRAAATTVGTNPVEAAAARDRILTLVNRRPRTPGGGLPSLPSGLGLLALALHGRLFVVGPPLHFLERSVLQHLPLEGLQRGLDLIVEDLDPQRHIVRRGPGRSWPGTSAAHTVDGFNVLAALEASGLGPIKPRVPLPTGLIVDRIVRCAAMSAMAPTNTTGVNATTSAPTVTPRV